MKEVWPNLFIVGAARSGTTSLYEYLDRIPGIQMSSIKEPHFFVNDYGPKAMHFPHVVDEKKYLSLFTRRSSEQILGEASPSYLWDEYAAGKIYRKSPDAKIVVLIRDPVERAYSQFLHYLRSGYETNKDFLSAVKTDYFSSSRKGWGYSQLYIELGMYHDQIKRYIELFGKERVKIVIFEDEFSASTEDSVQDIVNFLELRYRVSKALVKKRYNAASNSYAIPRSRLTWHLYRIVGKIRKDHSTLIRLTYPLTNRIGENLLIKRETNAPPLTEESFQSLRPIFKKDMIKLESLLDKSPSWLQRYK